MRTQTRWNRRDKKHHKTRWGMRMDGKATKTVLARLAATHVPARNKEVRR